MSSYFGALMRSSGLTVGSRTAATDAPAGPPAQDIVEINEVREVSQPPTVAVSPSDERRMPPFRSVERPVRHPTAPDPPSTNTSHLASRHKSDPLTVEVKESHLAERADDQSRAAAERFDPVRLAMQWIATDPEAQPVPKATAWQEPSLRTASPLPPTSTTHAVRGQIVEVHEQVMAVSSEEPRVRKRPEDSGIRALPPPPSPRRGMAQPDRPRRTAPFEERVEISIGAIDVHVEAPATQISTPAPAPRLQPASPTRAAERSGLERRYLRSF